MIVWIASYPKSGNTWVRTLLSSYLYSEDGIFNFDLLKKIPQFPSKKTLKYFLNDFSDLKKVSDYWIAAQDRINLFNENKNTFLKTHSALCTFEKNPFTNKNNTKAVIYVVRDPRNVITSLSNHYSLDIEESSNFMTNEDKMLVGDEWGKEDYGISAVLSSWSVHYKSWSSIKFAPVIIVKYEDLMKDTKNSLIGVLEFLKKLMDIKIDDKKILNTINSCNFENLAKMEKEKGFHEAVYSQKNKKKINFFHLGKKNDWKNLLDSKTTEKLNKTFYKEMKELGYI